MLTAHGNLRRDLGSTFAQFPFSLHGLPGASRSMQHTALYSAHARPRGPICLTIHGSDGTLGSSQMCPFSPWDSLRPLLLDGRTRPRAIAVSILPRALLGSRVR
jgi:hypothetical protein